jgi:subtilase family serine protease
LANLKLLWIVATILLFSVWGPGIQAPTTLPSQTPPATTTASASPASQSLPGPPCLPPTQADVSTAQSQPAGQNVSIPGHIVPSVRSGQALRKATVPNSTILQLELVFALRNEASFIQCLASLSDPTSPNYQHFLNATTLEPYVPTPGQKQSMVAFLERAGFTVSYAPSPIVLKLTGTVNAISRTFRTRLGLYQQGSGSFYSPDTEPKLPQNFAALTNAITGLDNFSSIRPAESPCTGPYCPQGVQIGYGLSNLFSAGYNGAGQTVAIVNAPGDKNTQAAINNFTLEYGLSSVTLDIRYPDGTPSSWNPSWAAEAAMDVEAVHSVAPGAGIVLLYDTADPMNGIDYVANNHLATIVSNSWVYTCTYGFCSDTELPPTWVSSHDSRLAIDAGLGLTMLFASGDDGSKPDGSNLGTEFPASDPNVLAVGATNLVLSGCGTSTCAGYGSETGAVVSGGGYSGYFAEPSWQTSTIGSVSGRAIPDVSMFGYSPNFWVYSTTAKSCAGASGAGWFPCAGTSLSTPLWAGVLAVALQIRGGTPFGNIGPRLYQLGASSSYSNDFHDIVSGSNDYHGSPSYSATTGWDAVTGWGTPIANSLVLDISRVAMFHTSPTTFPGATSPGTVAACGGTFSDGQVSESCGSSFSATANLPSPATGWQFDHWTWTGGVTCGSSSANPATCSVSGGGSLTAVYGAQVSFMTNPSGSSAFISWGSCASSGYGNGQSIFSTSYGSVTACYVPQGYTFSSWTCSGGLACSGSNNPTTVTFTGPGTITLNLKTGSLSNPVSTSLTVSGSPSSPTHGTSFTVSGTLTANGIGVGGETVVLVFGWNSNIVTVTTLSDGSFSYIATAPASAGSYKIQAFFLGDFTGSPQYLPSTATATITVT